MLLVSTWNNDHTKFKLFKAAMHLNSDILLGHLYVYSVFTKTVKNQHLDSLLFWKAHIYFLVHNPANATKAKLSLQLTQKDHTSLMFVHRLDCYCEHFTQKIFCMPLVIWKERLLILYLFASWFLFKLGQLKISWFSCPPLSLLQFHNINIFAI